MATPASDGAMMPSSTAGTAAPMPMPMTNEQALAYARSHRDTSIGIMTATNRLGAPICRIVFLSLEHQTSLVNQAGPHERQRGNLDPTEEPLLAAGEHNFVEFPNVPKPASGPTNMVVTAFGCDRTDKHFGRYVTDENTVVFQKTVAVQDQGKLVIARGR